MLSIQHTANTNMNTSTGNDGGGERRSEGTSSSCGIANEIPPPPDTWTMKQLRKQSTWAMGVATGVTGLLVGGPVLGVFAGFAGAVITKKKMKKRERKAIEKYQMDLAELLSPTFHTS